MIMSLAVEAGHPSLQQFPELSKEPCQNGETPIIKYLDNWLQYMQRMILTGHHYNDCFFFQQLFQNSHACFRPIFNKLRLSVHEQDHKKPLPLSLHMSSLITKITQLAQFVDSQVAISVRARELNKTMKPSVQQLKVTQITTPAPTLSGVKCFLCHEPHHLKDCPQLASLMSNEKGKGTLKRVMEMQQLLIQRLDEEEDTLTDSGEDANKASDKEYTSTTETESDFQEAG